MAIGVILELPGITEAQYEEALRRLTNGRTLRSLSDCPVKGLLSHLAGPTPSGWRVIDVWESEADLARFIEILMPIGKALGFPRNAPQTFPAHNFIKD
jgi:hypothetical protein